MNFKFQSNGGLTDINQLTIGSNLNASGAAGWRFSCCFSCLSDRHTMEAEVSPGVALKHLNRC